ncbi:MAG: Na+-dependent transporter [Haloarculaceae archaeon]
MRLTAAVEEYLLVWVLLAVAAGLLVPRLAVVTRFSTLILAVMVGSVSLTLTTDRFRAVDRGGLVAVLAGHAVMPLLAFGLARALELGPDLTAGFVLLGAVTPELVTPTMTELAGGDTALSSTVLVLAGVGSMAFVPAVTGALLAVDVAGVAIVEGLAVAVVAPMALAVTVRSRYDRLGAHEDGYTAVSAAMVVLIIGGVAAANADLVWGGEGLPAVLAGAVALNLVGYGLGYAVTAFADRGTRVAGTLSVGMRDFAVAAALAVAAGFPTAAALPAVVFGVVEMATSAAIAQYA